MHEPQPPARVSVAPLEPLSGRARAAQAEAVLYPLWDLRLEVGHAVRTVADVLALGREDLTAATAVVDARPLAGDRTLYDELARAVPRLFDRDPNDFVRRLAAEKAD